ncbi:MAG TPA: hypothetical protein VL551_35390 [Actinospica sp.]|jgi:hypothetical protein|nr:hypothetical protein [Actinospica sp.]
MTGKHRKPHQGAGRKVAATAAVLGAGALPIVAAGSAFAATAPAAATPLSALPLGTTVPLQVTTMAGPVESALPLAGTLARALTSAVDTGDLQNGLVGANTPQAQTREAVTTGQATAETADLASKTTALTGKLTSVVPVGGLVHEVAPAMAGQPMQLAPTLLQDGTVGTLTNGFGGKSMELTNGVVGQARPLVDQLQKQGVPTVGDVTTSLSQSKLPVFGSVGGLTAAVPVSEMVGNNSPVLGTVGAVSGL